MKRSVFFIIGLFFLYTSPLCAQILTLQNMQTHFYVLQTGISSPNVALIIDNSTSMLSYEHSIKRLARDVVGSLAASSRVILIPLNGQQSSFYSVSNEPEINNFIDNITFGGWTDLIGAIQKANRELADYGDSIIVVGDGRQETPGQVYYPVSDFDGTTDEVAALRAVQVKKLLAGAGGGPHDLWFVKPDPQLTMDPLVDMLGARMWAGVDFVVDNGGSTEPGPEPVTPFFLKPMFLIFLVLFGVGLTVAIIFVIKQGS